ncbi:hypothetical protein PI125_g9014 [Phytophthora idaei]|nr:hypothetical protein PI125_g9014 [Phytophthora idaei]KAG3157964.1 hypothetical protein PI126_g8073 [Phytophthora idaei]
MDQLRLPNNASELAKLTPLRAKTRNVTRWSSTYEMLQRYVKIRAHIRQLEAVEDLTPRSGKHKKLVSLLSHLEKFESVCKRLQSEATSMSEVRLLFDSVVSDYPIMGEYLKSNAKIVHSPAFENGLVKICNGEKLSTAESVAHDQMKAWARLAASARSARRATQRRLSSKTGRNDALEGALSTLPWQRRSRRRPMRVSGSSPSARSSSLRNAAAYFPHISR